MKFAKGKKFKQCPHCNFWVERTAGCDHMTCRCGKAFCYKCGGKYAARYAGNWIGCHRAGCGRWLHKKCVSEIDLINMSEEDFENFYF